jgi:hypothetical protein
MQQVFARQKVIFPTPLGAKVEVYDLPADPKYWWVPRDNAPTNVEIVGGSPTEELIQIAQQMGWKYSPYTGKFYYVG